jgi:hypothetical protein
MTEFNETEFCFDQDISRITTQYHDGGSRMTAQPVTEFNLTSVPQRRQEIARSIVKAFADAGFGSLQQLAALANAFAESGLDPDVMSAPPDQSVGLFQLNMAGGLGTGHTIAELRDPATNINIMVSAALKSDAFANAESLEDAVSIFVRNLIRPADPAQQVINRMKIAEQLAQTN